MTTVIQRFPHLEDNNSWVDFWRYQIGVNVIPADTKSKSTYIKWSTWQDRPIPEEQHNQWKSQNDFSKGIAIVPGKVWHNEQKKDLYFTFIDIDKSIAIKEFCTRDGKTISLQELSEKFVIEQHKDDLEKAHIYFYSPIPFVKKSADAVTGLEVKGLGEHGIAYCSPSIHKDGQRYEIIGTTNPITLTADQAKELMQQIDNICKKYGIEYLEKHHKNLLDSNSKIYEGSRHDSLIRIANSLLFRYGDDEKTEKEDLKDFFIDINNKRCEPPLSINELNSIWEDAVSYYTTKKEQEKKETGKNHHGKQSKEEQQESYAEILVQLATDNSELFFKDQYGTAFALVKINNNGDDQHREVIRIESNKFKRYLSKLFYDNQNRRVVNSDAINNAIQVIEAKTEYEGKTIPLSLRVAWKKENNNNEGNSLTTIYYDLTNPKWQYIKITNHQWELVDNNNNNNNSNVSPPILFVRYNQVPQVLPDRNYELDIFEIFLTLTNINDEQNRLLLKVYIVSLFIPDIAHAMLILHGEKGSAKSTLQILIKLLVDPAKPLLLTIHKDRTEFVQHLNHNHVAFYDNLKHVPEWLSDEACKAVTGVGQTKRKLYTDDDDIVYEYKRCLGFNGINISLTEPDALDRSILIELSRIAKEKRRVESEIISEFMELRPKLLGCIFDILVKALQIKPTLKLLDLPRMADFALWGEAISQAMGNKPSEFINAYYENIGRQNIEAIEAHPLGQAIAKYFEEGTSSSDSEQEKDLRVFEGPPMEILDTLEVVAEQHKVDTHHKLWPKSPNAFSRRLNQIRSNLLEGLGIDVTISRITTKKDRSKANTSYIKIRKISPIPPLSPPDQNQAQNQGKSGGDILDSGDNTSTHQQISPLENAENHAQKIESGGNGHSGDIIPILEEEHHPDAVTNNPLKSYVAFDLEWTTFPDEPSSAEFAAANSTETKIIAAAFVDSQETYKGGIVLQPKKGLYHNLIVADVTSLYPSMAILHNISFDTVNCECCKNDSECRINEDITKDCKIQKEYWICRQKEGAFPKKLKILKEERLKQKKVRNQVKQLALKILINAGYGVFGNRYFKYYDPRVAELITAYGRYTLSKMQEIAKGMGFEIVYGDTDSLFLSYKNHDNIRNNITHENVLRFQEECNRQLGVEVEHAKTYTTAIISDKKKHYVGWTGIEGKEPDIVGMEGDKNDRPKWINNVFKQTVYDIVVHNTDPIPNLKQQIVNLESGIVNPELLKRSNRLSKNPEEYENENDRKRKIGLAIGAKKGDVIEYFESDNNREGYSLNSQDISIKKYKIMLWKAVKDILEIAGYDIGALEQELILDSKDGHIAEPPSGVAGLRKFADIGGGLI